VRAIARYRQKDEVDLRWNRIRRRITRELDLQIADWREEALNELLGGAWEQYKTALSTGDVLELEAKYESFVKDVLDDVIDVTVDEAA
jgi:hypothetical protein